MKRTVATGLMIVAALVATGHAEIEPQSPEQLKAQASHVALGEVKMIFTDAVKDAQWLKTAGVVEIQVSKLEKGEKVDPGDAIYARFWRQEWIGKGDPPPFGSGHHLPKKGDKVRVYLKRNAGGYEARLLNGFEGMAK